jgi:hypothetical protein
MTDEELKALAPTVRLHIEKLEAAVREVILDLGPLRTEDLLQEISCSIRAMKFE